MPYFAPEAPMPMTSCAPKLAERKGHPANQAGNGTSGKKEVGAGPHKTLQHDPNSQHENEVHAHNDPVNGAQHGSIPPGRPLGSSSSTTPPRMEMEPIRIENHSRAYSSRLFSWRVWHRERPQRFGRE